MRSRSKFSSHHLDPRIHITGVRIEYTVDGISIMHSRSIRAISETMAKHPENSQ